MIIRLLLVLSIFRFSWAAHRDPCASLETLFNATHCAATERCAAMEKFKRTENGKEIRGFECPLAHVPRAAWRMEVKLSTGAWVAYVDGILCEHGSNRDPDRRNVKVVSTRCVRKMTQQEQAALLVLEPADCSAGHTCAKPAFIDSVDASGNIVGAASCLTDTTLEKHLYDGTWLEITNLKRSEMKFKYSLPSSPTVEIDNDEGVKFRCRTKKECKMADYFLTDCTAGQQTCTQPLDTLACAANSVLQMKTSHDGRWRNIDSLKCADKRFIVGVGGKDSYLVPVGFRCMQETNCLTQYSQIDVTACEYTEKCDKPTFDPTNNQFKCTDAKMILQVQVNKKWTEATSISCTNSKMSAKLAESTIFNDFPQKIRCVKLRCIECSAPCAAANCQTLTGTASTKWNECVSFKCAEKPLIRVGDKFWSTATTPELICVSKPDPTQNRNVWTGDGEERIETDQDAVCIAEVACSKVMPMKSLCSGKSHLCEKVSIDDHHPASCNGGQLIHDRLGKEQVLTGAYCNLIDGKWMIEKMKRTRKLTEEFVAGDNIFCRFADCEIDSSFIRDVHDECPYTEQCLNPVSTKTNVHTCHTGYELRYLQNDKRIASPTAKITCQRVQILVDGNAVSAKTKFRCAKTLFCMGLSPIATHCPDGLEDECTPITLNDDKPISCGENKKLEVVEREEETFKSIQCDKPSGEWRIYDEHEDVTRLEAGSHVFCVDASHDHEEHSHDSSHNPLSLFFLNIVLFILLLH